MQKMDYEKKKKNIIFKGLKRTQQEVSRTARQNNKELLENNSRGHTGHVQQG